MVTLRPKRSLLGPPPALPWHLGRSDRPVGAHRLAGGRSLSPARCRARSVEGALSAALARHRGNGRAPLLASHDRAPFQAVHGSEGTGPSLRRLNATDRWCNRARLGQSAAIAFVPQLMHRGARSRARVRRALGAAGACARQNRFTAVCSIVTLLELGAPGPAPTENDGTGLQ